MRIARPRSRSVDSAGSGVDATDVTVKSSAEDEAELDTTTPISPLKDAPLVTLQGGDSRNSEGLPG